MPGVLDQRLNSDQRQSGIDAFSLAVLEMFTPAPEVTAAEIRDELAALEARWREKQAPTLLY